jgi:simple sugar transport system ATP-binding protein
MTAPARQPLAPPLLAIRGVTKRFGNLVANDAISLDLAAGEVLALLGENGAGKTTLMNVLFGHYVADEGVIEIDGEALPPGNTDAALKRGVGMVHQHFTLADNLSVLDNVTLGTEPLLALRRKDAEARAKLARLADEFGLAADPDAEIGTLSVGERQRVEILKALYRGARILILDEPTAVLTPQEATGLFATLKSLTKRGLGIIFISHKLHEILAVSDRVAVLRRGEIVGRVATADADRGSLAAMMVGREVTRPRLVPMAPGDAVLSLKAVSLRRGSEAESLKGASLDIRAHEIVGLAGVAGNGQRALADLLAGLAVADSGTVELLGAAVTAADPAGIVARGVGRIPEDRHAMGVVGEMAVWENLISEDLRTPAVARAGIVIDKAAAIDRAKTLIADFDIRCEGPEAETRLLSGGNMQKLILARALSRAPRFILAGQPVRGLDEGAIAYVHGRLLEARAAGAGILLISEDLDELFALTDRIAVIYHGRLAEPVPTADATIAGIGLMMAGQGADSSKSTPEAANAH